MTVECERVAKRFGRHRAVRDLSLHVPRGSAYALVGSNGAGKTTTLRMLVNILQPDTGSAQVLGIDSRKLAREDFARIGYVSENQALPERLTVAQYFDYLRALYVSWDPNLERSLRRDLDLPPERRLGKLSHGMRMKTILAATLSFRPAVLILDEPLSGLDPLVRDEMVDGMLRQADETTILISSHEISEIESFTTHVGFMDRGELVFEDSIETLLGRFRMVDVTLTGASRLPDRIPATWLNLERGERSLRFVDTAFDSLEAIQHAIGNMLGPARVDAEPLSLREIVKALMRARRPEGAA
jgi:ABC-type multidrug transport system ATPase subunit